MKAFISFLGLAIAIALTGCGGSGGTSTQAQSGATSAASPGTEYVAPDAKGIQTMTVKSTAIPEYLELSAHIEPDPTRVVHVFAPTGGRITEMKVRPWDYVEKGQTIAQLESSDLSRAVAEYHKALADNEVKQKQLARAEDLLAHHAIAERDYQQAQADAQMTQAELAATREQIRVFGMDPEHATTELRVVAPRSGVVLDIGAALGEFSKSLDAPAPLCTIADISTVWALGEIYEKDYADAKIGEEAQVSLNAYPGEHWSGRVGVVSGAVDPTTHTLHVRVVLPNPKGEIKPAMFGTIRILRSSSQGILVPADAVVREGSDSYVFVGKGGGKFERRSVQLGRAFDGSLEVANGVNPGDTIVSEGALLLRAASQE
jgi:membrane fusion protein, heavy metal efflux system